MPKCPASKNLASRTVKIRKKHPYSHQREFFYSIPEFSGTSVCRLK